MTQLQVKVEKIFACKLKEDGSGWHALKTNRGSAAGEVGWAVKVGDALILHGEFTSWKGQRQFKFTGAFPDIPIDPRDQLHYCCERTKGIGPSMEKAIWDKYGADWQQIKPDIIPKLKPATLEAFRLSMESLNSEGDKVNFISFLMGKGATINMATAAWNRWERQSMGVVNNDCFKLADLPNQGFSAVDKQIRHNFGISDTDPRRIKAVVEYSMKQLTNSGSTVVEWNSLLSEAGRVTGGGVDIQLISDCVSQMFAENKLVGFHNSGTLCRKIDFDNELIIWEFLTC